MSVERRIVERIVERIVMAVCVRVDIEFDVICHIKASLGQFQADSRKRSFMEMCTLNHTKRVRHQRSEFLPRAKASN